MKINKKFGVIYLCLVLLSFNFKTLFSESTIGWLFADIIFVFFLCFGFLVFRVIYGVVKNQMNYFQSVVK